MIMNAAKNASLYNLFPVIGSEGEPFVHAPYKTNIGKILFSTDPAMVNCMLRLLFISDPFAILYATLSELTHNYG